MLEVLPSLAGLESLFLRLPRTYVRGFIMPPLRGWSLPIRTGSPRHRIKNPERLLRGWKVKIPTLAHKPR